MLETLKTEKLVLDTLPPVYTTELYETKCDLAFRHLFDSYSGEGKSLYTELADAARASSSEIGPNDHVLHV
jgi:hypothetical protein